MLFSRKEIRVNINAQVTWQFARNPETGHYIGICDALNLNAAGDSWEEFQACANDAIQLLFVDLHEDGELGRFLHDRGWQLQTEIHPGQQPIFDVPYGSKQVHQEMLV